MSAGPRCRRRACRRSGPPRRTSWRRTCRGRRTRSFGVIVVRVQVEVPGAVAGLVRHLVGVDLVVGAVGHVHGRAVGPDALGVQVARGIQDVDLLVGLAAAVAALAGVQLVGEELVAGAPAGVLNDPQRVAVPRDAPGPAVVAVQADVVGADAGLVRHLIGVDLAVVPVGHVHGRAVRPDAPWVGVAGPVQRAEVIGRIPVPSLPVVGVDTVIAVGHPDGGGVAPDAPGGVVGGVQCDLIVGVQGLDRLTARQEELEEQGRQGQCGQQQGGRAAVSGSGEDAGSCAMHRLGSPYWQVAVGSRTPSNDSRNRIHGRRSKGCGPCPRGTWRTGTGPVRPGGAWKRFAPSREQAGR